MLVAKMQKLSKLISAKTCPENSSLWLPLWMHLRDTAEIIKKLAEEWVPDSVINAAGLTREEFEKVSVWLAAIHDIGKCTALFQSRITEMLSEIREKLIESVKILPASDFRDARHSPHAAAGEAILLSYGVCRGTASIVGSHHGMPPEIPVSREYDLSKQDFEILKNTYVTINPETKQLIWKEEYSDYNGKFNDEKRLCELGSLVCYGNDLMVWLFPIETFNSFRNISLVL